VYKATGQRGLWEDSIVKQSLGVVRPNGPTGRQGETVQIQSP